MSSKPAATIGSMHTCPMCTGTVPHVGGPVAQGSPNVFFGGKPAATMGSICTCVGPPDVIIKGNATILINGKPAACMGDTTAHGGVITTGEMTVLLGMDSATNSSQMAVTPREKLTFPEISKLDKVQASKIGQLENLEEAVKNQEEAKKHGYLVQVDFSA